MVVEREWVEESGGGKEEGERGGGGGGGGEEGKEGELRMFYSRRPLDPLQTVWL